MRTQPAHYWYRLELLKKGGRKPPTEAMIVRMWKSLSEDEKEQYKWENCDKAGFDRHQAHMAAMRAAQQAALSARQALQAAVHSAQQALQAAEPSQQQLQAAQQALQAADQAVEQALQASAQQAIFP